MSRSLRAARLHTALLLSAIALSALPAHAQSNSATFTISAGSATITPTGGGSIPFTLTSVNGFAGSVVVSCEPPTVPAGVKIPYCGGGPIRLYTLTSDQVLNGTLALNAYGVVTPAGFSFTSHPALSIFLLVALLSGLTLRRRSARWLALSLSLAILAALSFTTGCASGPGGFTPGTYNYSVTAQQYGSVTPLEEGASAIVTIR